MTSTKAHTGMPASQVVIPDSAAVTPDSATVIPAPDQVRGFNIRDPVLRHHWIAGQARNDKSAVTPDSATVIPAPDQVRGFNIRDPVLRHHWIAGQARNDKSVVTPRLIRGRNDSAAFDLIGSVMNFRNVNRPPFFKAARQ
jgi:hypothetical protein